MLCRTIWRISKMGYAKALPRKIKFTWGFAKALLLFGEYKRATLLTRLKSFSISKIAFHLTYRVPPALGWEEVLLTG